MKRAISSQFKQRNKSDPTLVWPSSKGLPKDGSRFVIPKEGHNRQVADILSSTKHLLVKREE